MNDVFAQLAAAFPADKISWRVGSTSKDKTKGLALAYIDARDVMERLDAIVGPENWQDRYEVHGGKTICYLSICQRAFVPGFKDGSTTFPEGVIEFLRSSWVTKADGAGDSDIEAEKGALSDAFKRAAVKWGIGRYLYDVASPWVALELARDKSGELIKDKNGNPIVRGIEKSEFSRLAALLDGKKPQRASTSPAPQTQPQPQLTLEEKTAKAVYQAKALVEMRPSDPELLKAYRLENARVIERCWAYPEAAQILEDGGV
ncbi:Rad52/Rad22 family DNA repair protein [Ancylobacter sp.]|uniref:Rad52/Rad22 family DNA repair protein n=1 Tax=Ancylobacter sp. TaxID=1872567 RepID=UPI003C7A160A